MASDIDLSRLEEFGKGETPNTPPAREPIKAVDPEAISLTFDQSLSDTGWSLLHGSRVLASGNLRTTSDKKGHEANLERAVSLQGMVRDLVRGHGGRLHYIAHELPPTGNRMMRPESSLLAALAVRLAAPDIPMRMVAAQKAKKRITGNGNATKAQVREAVLAMDPEVANLKVKNQAIYDAIALGWVASEEKPW